MDFLLPLIVPLLLVIAIAAAGIFLIRAWNNRTDSAYAPYNVGRQEARVAMQVNVIRALAVVLFGSILLAILFVTGVLDPNGEEPPIFINEPAPTDTAVPPPTPENSSTPPPTEPIVVEEADTPTAVPAEPTPIDTETPAPTPTDSVPTAIVSSGVGVWLRAAPSLEGEQLEWLLEGTVLQLLDGSVEGDTFNWQEVRAPSGVIGWVAIDFIEISES